ncbi:NAD(P)/FAD-dependent oxidoreductase [Thermogladius sp. KZ2Tp1]|uniref:NAD(P)/FAD-dependent oxidoreductase n=1 Tax=Thermogladius sp. KZ2Tp1 TaxID=3136289 RepID=UPI003DA9D69B
MARLRVVIVGAGVVGASIARVLSRFEDLDVVVVEKEPDVGWGVSKTNTSIMHPCHEEDPEKYPLRARLCLEGNRLWREWVRELSIPARWPGEVIVYHNEEEEVEVRKYLRLAEASGVPGVRLLGREELRELEPNVNPEAVGGLYAPTAGLISPFEAVVAIVENAVENGVRLLTETRVERVVVKDGRVAGVETERGFIAADIVVNAAGLYADRVSHTAGVEEWFRVRPRRGQYLLFDEDYPLKPQRVLHTVPTPKTKGVYAITTVHGNLMVGPTAEDLPEEAREEVSTTREGVELLLNEASKMLRERPDPKRVIRFFAGLRPEPPGGNWLIKAYAEPWGFVNVAGIRSPGLTAAPAIANYVLELLAREYSLDLVEKRNWRPVRQDITRVRGRSLQELDELIKKNPDYGEIVCYCKFVSKAEVAEAVERMRRIGVKTVTLDGLKFRVYVGFGKCQGSLCRARVAKIVSELTGVEVKDVVVKYSSLGVGDVKAAWRGEV